MAANQDTVFRRLATGAVRHAGPSLGEHHADVYGRLLGIADHDLAALYERGVI